jgi:hypothetical protein
MGAILSLVPSALGLVSGLFKKASGGLDWAAGKSTESPKGAGGLASLAIGALGYWGIESTHVHTIGTVLIKLGNWLGGSAGP